MADILKATVCVMFQNMLHWNCIVSLFLYISVVSWAKFCRYTITRTNFLMTTISVSIDPTAPVLPACQIFSAKQDPALQNKISKEILDLAGNYFGHLEIPDWFSVTFSPQCVARENHGLWRVSVSTR